MLQFLSCGGCCPLRVYFPYRAVRSARRDKGNTPLPPLRGRAPRNAPHDEGCTRFLEKWRFIALFAKISGRIQIIGFFRTGVTTAHALMGMAGIRFSGIGRATL